MLFKTAATAVAFGVVASATYPAEVTYTSIDHVTITSCAPTITNCPARVTPTTHYAVSTCTEEGNTPAPPPGFSVYTQSSAPVPTPVYTSPVVETTSECTESSTPVYTTPAVQTTPVYTSPVVETTSECTESSTPIYTPPAVQTTPIYTPPAVQTTPVYTAPSNGTTPCPTPVPVYTTSIVTVCPGVNYCYATTSMVPSGNGVPSSPVYSAPSSIYTVPAASTYPGGNATVPTSPATPVPYSGNSASGNKVSAAVLAIAAVAGLMMAF